MPSGEMRVTCPNCQHVTSLPIAAVKRDNYYCSKCLQKIPMRDLRAYDQGNTPALNARDRRSSRGNRR
jgi:hypothetical protein